MQLLAALLPLVVFYAVESAWGLLAAVVSAIAISVGQMLWMAVRGQHIPRALKFSTGLIVVLGGITAASGDERFVLWSAAIGDFAIAAALLLALLLGKNPVYDLLEDSLDEPLHPLQVAWLRSLGWRAALVFSIHGVWSGWSVTQSRETWLFVTGPGAYVLLGGLAAYEYAVTRWRIWPAIDAEEKERGENG